MASLKPTPVADPEKQQHESENHQQQHSLSAKRESLGDELTVVSQDEDQNETDAPGEPHLDQKTEHSSYLVRWDGPDDPENPKARSLRRHWHCLLTFRHIQNWSRGRRWYITGVAGQSMLKFFSDRAGLIGNAISAGLLVLNCTFASSAPSGVLGQLIEEFSLSHTLAVLTIGLFVAGYCVGPLVWGPLSEQYGRRSVTLIAFFIYTAFQVGSALSHNTASVLIFRFLGGTFAASPLTTSGGIIADIWDAGQCCGVTHTAYMSAHSML